MAGTGLRRVTGSGAEAEQSVLVLACTGTEWGFSLLNSLHACEHFSTRKSASLSQCAKHQFSDQGNGYCLL